ncbi:uncharacterized protein SOCE26_041150 [Sorangium cellulosum]|uniref:Secreted protein n=1 Tax=Sorangium cellulosum TaxID=56 RepID=A0A2L0ETS8_SORCE|nr:hypothetical protein [Sorangium cellulosum]AUX42682.1 uncharacterized protein SOCE26_041150 [Sorangium cellulosum]
MKPVEPISYITSGILLALAVATTACGDDGGGGSGAAGGASGSGSGETVASGGGGGGGGGGAPSATSGGASTSAASSTSGAGASTSAASTTSSAAGGPDCPGPLEFDDNEACTFPGTCPSACGIEELGSRICTCSGGVADCEACEPPDAAQYPINPAAVDCSTVGGDGSAGSIRNTPCTEAEEGTSCIGNETGSARGCVCWDLGSGFQWECGSVNRWFAK